MAEFYKFCSFLFFIAVSIGRVSTRVVDIGENFNELKKDGRFWFVEFYAPWCGYCKRLEPIWEEVGIELASQNSNIVTARIDCTKHKELAEEYGIRGFPTLKFFRGPGSVHYRGSYAKEALVEFAQNSARPIMSELKTTEEFEQMRSNSKVFFLFAYDDTSESNGNKELVQAIAEKKISQVVFYTISSSLLPEDVVAVNGVMNLFVFKDGLHFKFEDSVDHVNESGIVSWVDKEKFPPFMYITDSNIHELVETGKMVVLLTFSKKKDQHPINKIMGDVAKRMAIENYTTFGKYFQFAGIFDTDVLENIMMSTVEVPLILVLDPKTNYHYIMTSSELSESFNYEQLRTFLQEILDGKAVKYGGQSFSLRIWRIWWDVRGSAKGIWAESRFIAVLIFGLPFLVFGFLIAMLCCLEPGSDDPTELEEDWEQREIKTEEKVEPVSKSSRLKGD